VGVLLREIRGEFYFFAPMAVSTKSPCSIEALGMNVTHSPPAHTSSAEPHNVTSASSNEWVRSASLRKILRPGRHDKDVAVAIELQCALEVRGQGIKAAHLIDDGAIEEHDGFSRRGGECYYLVHAARDGELEEFHQSRDGTASPPMEFCSRDNLPGPFRPRLIATPCKLRSQDDFAAAGATRDHDETPPAHRQ